MKNIYTAETVKWKRIFLKRTKIIGHIGVDPTKIYLRWVDHMNIKKYSRYSLYISKRSFFNPTPRRSGLKWIQFCVRATLTPISNTVQYSTVHSTMIEVLLSSLGTLYYRTLQCSTGIFDRKERMCSWSCTARPSPPSSSYSSSSTSAKPGYSSI